MRLAGLLKHKLPPGSNGEKRHEKENTRLDLPHTVVTELFNYRNGPVSTESNMNTTWTFVDGHLVATAEDGSRLVKWSSPPSLAFIVDLLNACPMLSRRFLKGWSGEL